MQVGTHVQKSVQPILYILYLLWGRWSIGNPSGTGSEDTSHGWYLSRVVDAGNGREIRMILSLN